MKFFNKDNLKGIFPHKGKRCYKVLNNWDDTVRWLPVKDWVPATRAQFSERYIPKDMCLEGTYTSDQVWRGLTGRLLVTIQNGLKVRDVYRHRVHEGASSWLEEVLPTQTLHWGGTGDIHRPSVLWLVED